MPLPGLPATAERCPGQAPVAPDLPWAAEPALPGSLASGTHSTSFASRP